MGHILIMSEVIVQYQSLVQMLVDPMQWILTHCIHLSPSSPVLPPVIAHVNSTSITVVWSRPPGKIRNTYTLSYTYQGPCAGGGASGTKSIGNATQYTITELAPYTNYSIVVSAVNSNGAMGPYTSPLFVVTGQSGKCHEEEY